MALVSFDKYTLNARLKPALLAFAPACLTIASLFPEKFLGWDLLVGVITTFGLTMLLENIARDMGKKKEPVLYEQWGGKPTTTMLRHNGSPLGATLLSRYHDKLKALTGINLPTDGEEKENPEAADQAYDVCVGFLRENTRDTNVFKLVHAENIVYGFRRNLLGMKPLGIVIAILGILVLGWPVYQSIAQSTDIRPIAVIAAILNLIMLAIWVFLVKPTWVKKAADTYARQLIAACEQLDVPTKEKQG